MKKKNKQPVSAFDLVQSLERDPEFLIRKGSADDMLRERESICKAEESELVVELKGVGVEVESVWNLVNVTARYPAAISILMDHLKKPYSDRVREGIARALAVKEARGQWSTLLSEYLSAPQGVDENGFRLGAKDGLACALSVIATDENTSELIALLQDPTNGDSRVLLLSALRRTAGHRVKMALELLKGDPALRSEILSWGND